RSSPALVAVCALGRRRSTTGKSCAVLVERVRHFRPVARGCGLIPAGHARTHYARLLARRAVMQAAALRMLVDEIEAYGVLVRLVTARYRVESPDDSPSPLRLPLKEGSGHGRFEEAQGGDTGRRRDRGRRGRGHPPGTLRRRQDRQGGGRVPHRP